MSDLNYKDLQEKGIFDVPYKAFQFMQRQQAKINDSEAALKEALAWVEDLKRERDFLQKKCAELRQLVESHELVKSYGGIDKAKDFISPYSNEQLNKKVYSPMLRIKQAIADVENCDSYTPMRSR